MMLFYVHEPLGGLRTHSKLCFLFWVPRMYLEDYRIKPIEDLFSDYFIIIHLFIWTYLIRITLQKGCMMLFYTQESLCGLRTTPNPAFFLGFPDGSKNEESL